MHRKPVHFSRHLQVVFAVFVWDNIRSVSHADRQLGGCGCVIVRSRAASNERVDVYICVGGCK
jgi:hypothetical protein